MPRQWEVLWEVAMRGPRKEVFLQDKVNITSSLLVFCIAKPMTFSYDDEKQVSEATQKMSFTLFSETRFHYVPSLA